jgi:multiple antibiotic resistance protein
MGVAIGSAVRMDQQTKKQTVFMAIFLSAPRASCRNARTSIIEIIRDALAGYKGVSLSTDENQGEPFIVPLAIPLIAGPSTMATIMVFGSQPERLWLWVGALVVAWILSSAILMLSPSLGWLLGRRGLRACERLMGMILTVVAVQMFLNGVRHFLSPAG